jgi:hypothetical protein
LKLPSLLASTGQRELTRLLKEWKTACHPSTANQTDTSMVI